mmetsp:Transcript_6153/g.10930  ORF Transcript_6153/g.10930 Transcript_6153/m.10930 type:complete len:835 (+) Transcript_6153:183-2687(+)
MGNHQDEEACGSQKPPKWAKLQHFRMNGEDEILETLPDVPLTHSVFWIGRLPRIKSKGCHLVLQEAVISSLHCKLSLREDKQRGLIFEISDSSTNGTFVNRKKVGRNKSVTIKDGDLIVLSRNMPTTSQKEATPSPAFRFHVDHNEALQFLKLQASDHSKETASTVISKRKRVESANSSIGSPMRKVSRTSGVNDAAPSAIPNKVTSPVADPKRGVPRGQSGQEVSNPAEDAETRLLAKMQEMRKLNEASEQEVRAAHEAQVKELEAELDELRKSLEQSAAKLVAAETRERTTQGNLEDLQAELKKREFRFAEDMATVIAEKEKIALSLKEAKERAITAEADRDRFKLKAEEVRRAVTASRAAAARVEANKLRNRLTESSETVKYLQDRFGKVRQLAKQVAFESSAKSKSLEESFLQLIRENREEMEDKMASLLATSRLEGHAAKRLSIVAQTLEPDNDEDGFRQSDGEGSEARPPLAPTQQHMDLDDDDAKSVGSRSKTAKIAAIRPLQVPQTVVEEDGGIESAEVDEDDQGEIEVESKGNDTSDEQLRHSANDSRNSNAADATTAATSTIIVSSNSTSASSATESRGSLERRNTIPASKHSTFSASSPLSKPKTGEVSRVAATPATQVTQITQPNPAEANNNKTTQCSDEISAIPYMTSAASSQGREDDRAINALFSEQMSPSPRHTQTVAHTVLPPSTMEAEQEVGEDQGTRTEDRQLEAEVKVEPRADARAKTNVGLNPNKGAQDEVVEDLEVIEEVVEESIDPARNTHDTTHKDKEDEEDVSEIATQHPAYEEDDNDEGNKTEHLFADRKDSDQEEEDSEDEDIDDNDW